MRAEATITSRGAAIEPSDAGPPGVGQGRGEVPQQVERTLVGPLQVLEAQADRLEGRDLDEEGRQGAEDVVGFAAEIDLLVRLARQVLAQLGRDAEQLAAVVVDDGQQPSQPTRRAGRRRAWPSGPRRAGAASRRSWSRSSAINWRMISTNGWNGDEVAVEAPSLVDLAAVAAGDALGLLNHAALADPRLAADDDQRGRRLARPEPAMPVDSGSGGARRRASRASRTGRRSR